MMHETRIRPGRIMEVRRTFTQADFDRFAELSGDDNPIHVDAAFAAKTRFGRTLCHGMLLFSATSAALHAHLPGARIQEQALKFPGPTFAGDACTIRLEVLGLSEDEKTATISAIIVKDDGTTCLEGRTEAQLP